MNRSLDQADVPHRGPAVPGLLVLCTASFLAVADTTLVAIALPPMRSDLGMDVGASAWVLTGYSLTFGGLLLLCGRLGDLHGRLRVFRAGLVLFAVASLVAALAWHPGVLVAMRLAQGVGAAAFVPASLALLNAAAPDDRARTRAVGVYGAAASVGFVTGMLGGGVLTELAGWRSVFLVVLPVAAGVLVGSRRLTEPVRPAGGRLDVAGAVIVTLGVGALIYALTAIPEHGWRSAVVLGAGATGLALLALFPVLEARAPSPLVARSLGTDRRLLAAYAAVALQSMVGISWLFLLSTYFQDLHGHGPLASGLLFTPMTLAGVCSAVLAGRVVHRVGARRAAVLGMAVVAAGVVVMVLATRSDGAVAMVVGSVVGEAGFLLSNVALTVAGTDHPDPDVEGVLAGVLNTAIQLGTAVGLGVVAAVTAALLPRGLDIALRAGFVVCLAAALAGMLLGALVRSSAGRRPAGGQS